MPKVLLLVGELLFCFLYFLHFLSPEFCEKVFEYCSCFKKSKYKNFLNFEVATIIISALKYVGAISYYCCVWNGFRWLFCPVSHILVPDLFINECLEVPSDFCMYLKLYLLRYLWVQALNKFQSTFILYYYCDKILENVLLLGILIFLILSVLGSV